MRPHRTWLLCGRVRSEQSGRGRSGTWRPSLREDDRIDHLDGPSKSLVHIQALIALITLCLCRLALRVLSIDLNDGLDFTQEVGHALRHCWRNALGSV